MAHDYHQRGEPPTCCLEQLCSTGICLALGIVAVLLYFGENLDQILDSRLLVPVLISGITLTGLAAIRGVSMWIGCGPRQHQHAHANSSKGQGWVPWRYVVLLLPLILYVLGMPSQAAPVEEPLPDNVQLGYFPAICYATLNVNSQAFWADGRLYRVRGMYAPGRQGFDFRIFRLKKTTCAADSYNPYIYVKLRPQAIGADCKSAPLPEFQTGQWVNVTGTIQFKKAAGHYETLAIIEINSGDDVQPTSPENPYLPD